MLHPEIEALDRDGILKIQDERLAALGDRLANAPEWVEHFKSAGLSPRDLADRQALEQVPMLEKADLRKLQPFPMLSVASDKVIRFFATSGTTGLPVLFGFTERDLNETLANQVARQLHCNGVRPGDRAYQGYGYGLWIGGPAFDRGLERLGATCFPVGPGRGELVVEWMRDQDWVYASLSPLWLMTLTRIAAARGIDPKRDWRMRIATTGGQSVSRAFSADLEAAMPDGFVSHNCYGTTEAGGPIVSTSCAHSHDRDEMHLINEDTILTEVVDPKTLKPAAPGEIGEIVITTLAKEASPVVRWRTRDLVRLSDRAYDCECGRKGLPTIGRIIGRTDDMLKVRGVIVYPSQIEDVIAGTPGTVTEAWQVYVDKIDQSYDTVTVAVEIEDRSNREASDLAAEIERGLTDRLGLKVLVECHPKGALPRYEAKATRVLVREKGGE
jgi:phenylacetate-coenzyme A ligase PaaK-like adenylate-forming protein